jgi:hypothetical protein
LAFVFFDTLGRDRLTLGYLLLYFFSLNGILLLSLGFFGIVTSSWAGKGP